MSSYNIAVIYPSRGLLYTETLKEVLRELAGLRYTIYWSHANTLPDCFNKPLRKALKRSHTHIWLIEDDVVFPEGILKHLLEADEEIIACDYPLVLEPSGTVLYDCEDNAVFTGTGCMLAKASAFSGMALPIFRSDIRWKFAQVGQKVKFTAENAEALKVYGHHDISFGLYRYLNHEPIKVSSISLAQRKLIKKGDNSTNNGADKIAVFDKYRKISFNNIGEIEEADTSKDLLTPVLLDGRLTFMVKATADRLLREGFVDKPVLEHKNVMIDLHGNKRAIKYLLGR